ncbi:MAG: glycyl-radical enzyme activating protein [Kiritimatiellae bacterium]|nr:glycyl-radical enzyme activating protein [Kiritimatiellia bacterium]MDD5522128.1 glycyl-radical enzyme activating protein [Kiritimatiellia bacterium]
MNIFAMGWSNEKDGPGWRLMFYLKGCNFHCRWCANPEGLSREPQMMFYAHRSQFAEQACPYDAIYLSAGIHNIRREKCNQCSDRPCLRVWHHPAFDYVGQNLPVERIIDQARHYKDIFGDKGGVTFGGGEATFQMDELLEALKGLKDSGIHTTIETNASSPKFDSLFGLTDLLICDLKCISAHSHKEFTGSDNKLVLDNLRQAAQKQLKLIIRIALIHGFNNNDQEMAAMTDFLAELRRYRRDLQVDILRQHHLGEPKYIALGIPYPLANTPLPTQGDVQNLIDRLKVVGIDANRAS